MSTFEIYAALPKGHESLHLQLRQINSKINVSLLCPGLIKTRMLDSARNRPAELQNESTNENVTPQQQALIEKGLEMMKTAMTPEQYAEIVFSGIKKHKFYILSEDKYVDNVEQRMKIILNGQIPEISKHLP